MLTLDTFTSKNVSSSEFYAIIELRSESIKNLKVSFQKEDILGRLLARQDGL
jgi:hypothetical protein